MSELEKYDFLTEQDEYMFVPFAVCFQYIEQFYEHSEKLKSSMISLIEFPDCWKIYQSGYHSEYFLYEGLRSGDPMKIKGSEKTQVRPLGEQLKLR